MIFDSGFIFEAPITLLAVEMNRLIMFPQSLTIIKIVLFIQLLKCSF